MTLLYIVIYICIVKKCCRQQTALISSAETFASFRAFLEIMMQRQMVELRQDISYLF